jgi:ribosomal protein S18 acetylase RimI-like enzyme
MVQIRRATVDDAELIAQLVKPVHDIHVAAQPDFFKPYALSDELIADFRQRLLDPVNTFLIAEADGEAVGYVFAQVIERPDNLYSYASRYLLVDQISVNPEARSKRYGEALMQAVFDLAKLLELPRVMLGVWAFNQRAIAFYERLGFAPRDTRMEVNLG